MNVVVVESPAKAKTINKYLGSAYQVIASYGHVRDLPPKDGSVDPDNDFAMVWQVDAKAAKRLNELARAVKGADRLILATDPDREGEAISWHVLQVLKEKKALKAQPVQRVVFNAITKKAVLDAMDAPREIETHLVDAYRAANVQVQVSDMRAAVEKHNVDGSIDVLVAVRVKVTNSEAADQEQGYRLRVQMAPVDGTYKIAKLDQVNS